MRSFLPRRRSKRSGFTLLELSIVAMLLGSLLVLVFGTYTSLLRISKAASDSGGATKEDAMLALENLRSTLSMAYFLQSEPRLIFVSRKERKDGKKHPGERGQHIVFAAVHPNSEETSLPEVREVEFFIKDLGEDNGLALIRREDEIVDRYPFSGGQDYTLLENVKSLSFKFSKTGSKWDDEWDSREAKSLPRLIRIEMIAKIGKDERRFETLAFPGILLK
ncbi:prepilin-type cleavage/methylation domain-containing protein [Leptospira perolatii]|uniref:Type II secretion system protein J n=1 Tax=Leptospira perolatii TaxID=2023191 RepID=A0A2M9ZIG7_9LEPT|nr:type II secretion system protein GspJ [Leptospira perolatii]PJZ68528.1 prepilin-type cleavage/methylation domain-containing protein [Leptospira perolatii]PJZ71858.1 prepilin-type cleavage/methylation domain-containing protein [Leptospira perolatii]